jgi:exodeoxyribonuclease-5
VTSWPPQQDNALVKVADWLKNSDEQLFYLAGYAGVGKTTLARHFAEGVEGRTLFAAYTGKAALVLRRKGCPEASTIHRLIYTPAGEAGGPDTSELSRQLRAMVALLEETAYALPADGARNPQREALERDISFMRKRILKEEKRRAKPMFHLNEDSPLRTARLLVVDECSMVDEAMAEDMLSFGTKILVLGDPAQLPPVGSGGYFTKRRPDVLLTQVHRQALDSGILRLATMVREGMPVERGSYGDDCEIVAPGGLEGLVLETDQLLVGRNATRHRSNQRYRELTGRGLENGRLPEGGDKLVCLRNDHQAGLLNGSLWRVHEVSHFTEQRVAEMTVSSEEDDAMTGIQVSAHTHHFLGEEMELRQQRWNRLDHQEFDYGYALTVHKAQGSQWDDVVLFDESHAFFHGNDAQRWLYTGITRAARKLTVVR